MLIPMRDKNKGMNRGEGGGTPVTTAFVQKIAEGQPPPSLAGKEINEYI